MAKSKKKPQGKKSKRTSKKDKLKQLKSVLAEANAQADPLGALPPAFLSVALGDGAPSNDGGGDIAAERKVATIRHFASALPPSIHKQCLGLFETNMGDLYRKSHWGLDTGKKEEELGHPDARFVVLLSQNDAADGKGATGSTNYGADDSKEKSGKETINYEGCTVLGFAHFRHEADDDDDPHIPVTYLYELQVHPSHQKLGLGKKLMTVVELISMKMKMAKIMLTVFHANEGAMKFYLKRKYEVDESSPSNYEGMEDCDYEILSKPLGSEGGAQE